MTPPPDPRPARPGQYKIGWYQVAFSDDIPRGGVRTLRFFGREFVAFRSRGGALTVVDPQCPHLGAHLGHGSKVVGGQLECRFHGWRFDGSGRCRHIPYSDGVPRKAKLRIWRTVERNTGVYLYYDPAERHAEPAFAVPDFDRSRARRWMPPLRGHTTGRLQPYDLLENGVDMGHFVHIHGFRELPAARVTIEGPVFHTAFESRVGFAGRTVEVEVDASLHGPGIVTQWIDTGIRLASFLNATPLDGQNSAVFVTNFVDADSLPRGMRRVLARFFQVQYMFNLRRDVQIFSRRRNPRHPVLCAGDGPIIKYRQWFRGLPDAEDDRGAALFDIREPRRRAATEGRG